MAKRRGTRKRRNGAIVPKATESATDLVPDVKIKKPVDTIRGIGTSFPGMVGAGVLGLGGFHAMNKVASFVQFRLAGQNKWLGIFGKYLAMSAGAIGLLYVKGKVPVLKKHKWAGDGLAIGSCMAIANQVLRDVPFAKGYGVIPDGQVSGTLAPVRTRRPVGETLSAVGETPSQVGETLSTVGDPNADTAADYLGGGDGQYMSPEMSAMMGMQ